MKTSTVTPLLAIVAAGLVLSARPIAAQEPTAITFNKNFEAGALGKIEKLADNQFRCHVEGQSDEHGRNRQANWYYFQMAGAKGREIKLTLTDFVGEYNGQPGACPMTAETIPVFSNDNVSWQHFSSMAWDDQKKEATLRFTPENDRIWIAHVPPYPHSRLVRLLQELAGAGWVRTEVIGKSAQGRDLHVVTITNFDTPDDDKKTLWLIARQHAWETGTSYAMEGALRFVSSDDPTALELRSRAVFKFTPTMDPDGCASGKVRFNANGYDLNRHWDEVDLRRRELLERMPEIWYVKKSILSYVDAGHSIDLLVNMHNDEMPESLETQVTDEPGRRRLQRLFSGLTATTSFDPTSELRVSPRPDHTTTWLYQERRIPVVTMERRIGPSKKLGRQATVEDNLEFGRQLVGVMTDSVTQ